MNIMNQLNITGKIAAHFFIYIHSPKALPRNVEETSMAELPTTTLRGLLSPHKLPS